MKNKTIILGLLAAVMAVVVPGCCVYRYPPLHGKVIDIETGESVPGVSVEVDYVANYYAIVDQTSQTVFYRVARTDSEGKFEIPSVFTLTLPHLGDEYATVDFYKEGYTRTSVYGRCFSVGCEKITHPYLGDKSKQVSFSSHLVELAKLFDVPKQRYRVVPVAPPGVMTVSPQSPGTRRPVGARPEP